MLNDTVNYNYLLYVTSTTGTINIDDDDFKTTGRLQVGTGSVNFADGDGDVYVADEFENDGIAYLTKVRFVPIATQTITGVGSQIEYDAATIILNPDGDYTLTSTPTITKGDADVGSILYLITADTEPNVVTIQDQNTLANSNVELGAASRAVGARDVLTLMHNGTNWVEVSYANN